MDRRKFLSVTGAAGLATVWGGSLACARSVAVGSPAGGASATRAASAFPLASVGLQLYTVRNLMAQSVERTLGQVAAAGYHLVETAGLYDRTPAALRALFDQNGIRTTSGHYPLADLEKSPDAQFATAKTLGQEYVVMPWLEPALRTPETFKSLPGRLNKLGEQARAAGLKLAYHNHDFEFDSYGGPRTAHEELLAGTDPALVSFELDAYWVFKAGHDPVEIIQRHPGRISMVHLKDSTPAPQRAMADVGKGVIDWAKLISAAQANGLRYAFVERDDATDALDSIRTSHAYLETLLGAR
jgi:sugar phosphate isomerase/epimerase